MAAGESLDHDWFTEYFQEEQADRTHLKQDYTPDSLCELVSYMSSEGSCADICAGTGGLTLKMWEKGCTEFYCVEFSERAVPILLFNLAIRNTKATIWHCDALTHEVFNCYELEPSEKYSTIEKVDKPMEFKADTVVMNPPYSLKWDGDKERIIEPRFLDYAIPPKNKVDYAFILDGLERLNEGGHLVAILPHGVLFRGASEGKIRQKLIVNKLLNAVVGLPSKLFIATQIPVCIKQFIKGRETDDILLINADKEFKANGKQSILEEKNLDNIKGALSLRKDVKRFAGVANFEKIKKNVFILNIPRYVDTYIPEPVPNFVVTCKELIEVEEEIKLTNCKLLEMLDDLHGTDRKANEALTRGREILKGYYECKN